MPKGQPFHLPSNSSEEKRYDLLYAEIQARKALGNVTKETADKKISEKYGSDVAALQEDYNQKLQLSQQYYSELGTLTKEQSEQQKREELKLILDLYQKRYDLLYAEIQARKALGNVTKEDYNQK